MHWMHTISLLVAMFCYVVDGQSACDSGEANQTITVPCWRNASVSLIKYKQVLFKPGCTRWQRFWSFFNGRCNTRYRTHSYIATELKRVPSYCNDTVCCPGYFMSDGVCVTGCPNGTYGENCTNNCTCPENAYPGCEKDTGNCTCKPGLMGDNCTEPCPDGYYGDDCRHECCCKNNATCDIETGQCNCSVPGWTGQFCHLGCNGTFGLNCSRTCTCNENQTCDPSDGSCTCKPGHCGYNCSEECEDWMYGVDCLLDCNCDVNTTMECDKVNGYCQCRPGFIGQNCSDLCPMGFYGDNCKEICSCIGTPYCDHVNGTCICLGKHGENCTEDCNDEHYGPDCSRTCNCTGGNYNGTCDSIRGFCHCNAGWQGNTCTEQMGSSGSADAPEDEMPEDGMTTELVIILIAACCAVLIIATVIVFVILQRRRRYKCFEREQVNQYKNATYGEDQALEASVLRVVQSQSKSVHKGSEVIFNTEDSGNANNSQHCEVTNNGNPNNDGFAKKETSLELESEYILDQHIDYEFAELGNNEILHRENESDKSDHYSDVDSLKEEYNQSCYSFADEGENSAVDAVIKNQENAEDEQYDSLENSMTEGIKKPVRLPNYSSFEEVQKEKENINKSPEETDEPYDKISLCGQQKKTLTRNDYNTFNIANKTTEARMKQKHALSSKCNNSSFSKLSQDTNSGGAEIYQDDSEYNLLDHTNTPICILNNPSGSYNTTDIRNTKDCQSSVTEENIQTKKENKEESFKDMKLVKERTLSEEPEYNKLDHTGKLFRVMDQPDNVYHKRELTTISQDTYPNGDEAYLSDTSNNGTGEAFDSEYNSLDPTGRSFQTVVMPDNIYDNKAQTMKTDNKTILTSLDTGEEEDSYSFCEIDDSDTEHNAKVVTDDEKSVYEIPEVSNSDINEQEKGHEANNIVSKVKHKTKQRRLDDYEPYELSFGNSPS